MINIALDIELDKETLSNFFDLKVGGVNFRQKILTDYPDITKSNYQQYIDTYYIKNSKSLEKSLFEVNDIINKTQNDFFSAVKMIFMQEFSQQNYNGYLSIFDCNPRYLDKKIFQVYYKRDISGKVEIVFHEVLHFIFFDYCKANYKDLVKGLSQNSGPYWDLSEIFNVIILNRPAFQKILKSPELVFYPEHKQALPLITNLWNENRTDFGMFIKESLKILS